MPDVLPCRSVAEAHLFLDLAGADPNGRDHRLEADGDDLIAVYEVRVKGSPRTYRFHSPENPLAKGFGGAEPSEIIDAGQFLMHADRLAKSVSAEPAPEYRATAAARLERAAAALDEVMKFIPDGEDRVPADALWNPMSKVVYASEPGRFRRARLEAVAETYRGIAAQFRSPA